ncbi:MAG: hypothetical protein JSS34_05580 [Proteobacteria bacterium]|nr:hypothetical protein [Pseudomonadota bacterium]
MLFFSRSFFVYFYFFFISLAGSASLPALSFGMESDASSEEKSGGKPHAMRSLILEPYQAWTPDASGDPFLSTIFGENYDLNQEASIRKLLSQLQSPSLAFKDRAKILTYGAVYGTTEQKQEVCSYFLEIFPSALFSLDYCVNVFNHMSA